mmetsp:Transcript_12873/g.19017  ORF Transcript_12873/g.19017 Transcript_12873/m.19017 type:complete len:134 (-) Transcript_12873:28-429(-)
MKLSLDTLSLALCPCNSKTTQTPLSSSQRTSVCNSLELVRTLSGQRQKLRRPSLALCEASSKRTNFASRLNAEISPCDKKHESAISLVGVSHLLQSDGKGVWKDQKHTTTAPNQQDSSMNRKILSWARARPPR